MADDRSMLEKLLNMLAADDMTALVAVRKIRAMAEKEKKTVGDLCIGGQTVYVERVVYKDAAPRRGPVNDDLYEAMRRAAQGRRGNRQGEREEAHRRADEKAQSRYHGAFDDAEMSDAEREEVRSRRAEQRRKRANRRVLLDELAEAGEVDDAGLSAWEIEFATTVPYQYTADYDLSDSQRSHAERIIRKAKRNQGESPI